MSMIFSVHAWTGTPERSRCLYRGQDETMARQLFTEARAYFGIGSVSLHQVDASAPAPDGDRPDWDAALGPVLPEHFPLTPEAVARLLTELFDIFGWVLGERGEFTPPPDERHRPYWWRPRIRRRIEHALRGEGGA